MESGSARSMATTVGVRESASFRLSARIRLHASQPCNGRRWGGGAKNECPRRPGLVCSKAGPGLEPAPDQPLDVAIGTFSEFCQKFSERMFSLTAGLRITSLMY